MDVSRVCIFRRMCGCAALLVAAVCWGPCCSRELSPRGRWEAADGLGTRLGGRDTGGSPGPGEVQGCGRQWRIVAPLAGAAAAVSPRPRTAPKHPPPRPPGPQAWSHTRQRLVLQANHTFHFVDKLTTLAETLLKISSIFQSGGSGQMLSQLQVRGGHPRGRTSWEASAAHRGCPLGAVGGQRRRPGVEHVGPVRGARLALHHRPLSRARRMVYQWLLVLQVA